MRIAFVVNNFPPRVGGVEYHVANLARELAGMGHSVLVYTLGDSPGETSEDGLTIARVRERWRIGNVLGFPPLGTVRSLRRRLQMSDVDVVSVHTRFFPLSWLGGLAARSLGIPVVHTEHGGGYVVSDSKVVSVASRLVDHTVGRWHLRRATSVLGVSSEVLRFVERLSGRHGELFFNAICPPSVVDLAEAPARSSHLVFVGRLVPGKGWEVFIDIVVGLLQAGVPVTAEILGDGPDMRAMRDRVASSGFPDSFDVRGRLSPGAVRQSLRGATLVNPTRLAEGFQTTLLEAIAEGGRVVTYEVPGARLLFDLGAPVSVTPEQTPHDLLSAITDLLADPPPIASSALVESWCWPTRAREYIEICERLFDYRRDDT